MNDCGQRAFEAGLRWAGINDKVPPLEYSQDIAALCEKYGLVYSTNGKLSGNDPVLVIYRDDRKATDSEYHAVFASDVAPFWQWHIYAVVTGWVELRSRHRWHW